MRNPGVSIVLGIVLFGGVILPAGEVSEKQNEIFWKIADQGGIYWDVAAETRLPHGDNIEMSGRNVAAIIHYKIDENKRISVERDILFPQLQVFIGSSEAEWRKYRAYLRGSYDDRFLPAIILEERTFEPGPVQAVRIDGMLQIEHAPVQGVRVIRRLYPSMSRRLFVEQWTLVNDADSVKHLRFGPVFFEQQQAGKKGTYRRRVTIDAPEKADIPAGGQFEFAVNFSARLDEEAELFPKFAEVWAERQEFLEAMRRQLVLETADPVLDTLFYFSKIRAAESIYETGMGLVHSPGGGRYYTGVWANDQAEYSGPLFPWLGYGTGTRAALNAYRKFAANIPASEGHFWSSFEMNGEIPCCGSDRGDAAMIAFGASQFALVSGSPQVGRELWPLISWSLAYCQRHKNAEGVIESDTDEMEGRIPTGTANLSTSCLYYGALQQASRLAAALGMKRGIGEKYRQQGSELERKIEAYFGADIEGLHTYKYFKEHQFLRHWICLPLVMGIEKRKQGTIEALFGKLWTANGVRVEYNPALAEPDLFWDRGTLYAFRGAFKAGAADRALAQLQAYSRTRLLGFHVPYVVEAWPEGNMAHLSAESALYCRIFTEGLLGIEASGFHSFSMRPHLPRALDSFKLSHIRAFAADFDITLRREKNQLRIVVSAGGKTVFNALVREGKRVHIRLPGN